jgi:hypothetical protein
MQVCLCVYMHNSFIERTIEKKEKKKATHTSHNLVYMDDCMCVCIWIQFKIFNNEILLQRKKKEESERNNM